MGKRKAEACLPLLLLSTRVPVLPRTWSATWNGTTWESRECLAPWGLGWGLQAWPPNRALPLGLLRPLQATD